MDFISLLELMNARNASDLFISGGIAPSLKINGKILPISRNILTNEQAESVIFKVMPAEQRQFFSENNEANFAIDPPGVGRYRVNVYRHQNQVGMVLRHIVTDIPSLDQLQLPALYKEIAMYRQGLVLVVGATGSGKSSTLAGIIDYRNKHGSDHIVCIEDPIEFIHKPERCIITQREVGFDTSTFETGLQNALRQAPDIIVIGEIRNAQTMSAALQFAETGHLCLATLHATNSNQAFDRIKSFFPDEQRQKILMELSLSLKSVIAQRLVPTMDETGRRVVSEILVNTPFVANQLLKGETHELKNIIAKSAQHGMRSFEQSLYELYQQGLISYEEALCHADLTNELRLMIKLNRHLDIEDTLSNMSSEISLIEEDTDSISVGRFSKPKSKF